MCVFVLYIIKNIVKKARSNAIDNGLLPNYNKVKDGGGIL